MMRAETFDPVLTTQATFRAILDATAAPGTVRRLAASLSPPLPLLASAAAVALTLCDHDTPAWLDAGLRASDPVREWLRFHCGCKLVDAPRAAAFAFVSDPPALPPFETFNPGTPDYPDRSTTIVLQVDSLRTGAPLRLTGPGNRTPRILRAAPLPHDMAARLSANRELFPCGVDLILVSPDEIAALPRSVRVAEGKE